IKSFFCQLFESALRIFFFAECTSNNMIWHLCWSHGHGHSRNRIVDYESSFLYFLLNLFLNFFFDSQSLLLNAISIYLESNRTCCCQSQSNDSGIFEIATRFPFFRNESNRSFFFDDFHFLTIAFTFHHRRHERTESECIFKVIQLLVRLENEFVLRIQRKFADVLQCKSVVDVENLTPDGDFTLDGR